MTKNIFKSIGAILAGIITAGVLSALTDFVLESTGIFTPPEAGLFTAWMIIVAVAYRFVFQMLGGYITATLAPNHPLRHAVILGSIGTLFNILGALGGTGQAPWWFFALLIITALPSTWLGGKLKLMQKGK